MVTPLLMTKLHIPRVWQELVPRPRLIERLDAGLHRKLTILSAPAGFGKTTLLSSWIFASGFSIPDPQIQNQESRSPNRVAWLSLDADDNDPARFWAYLIAALQTAAEGIGEGVSNAPPPDASGFLTSLINQISPLPHRLVLVLDDYHLVTTAHIHDALTLLLEHQPPNLHLVIATRADPPLPLPRLRARGQLTELRQSDLRFTPEEAAAFLNNVMGLELSAQDVAALEARTEGWIAGLQMAALSLQGCSHQPTTRSEFVQAFTGSHRFVLDYLVEEVLDQQPPVLQEFLLKTSILERLTGSLCDAILEEREIGRLANWDKQQSSNLPIPNSQAILEHLEAANLFIVPLDEERRWYRYHRLFAELLRRCLTQSYPNQVPDLHRRASEWHEQQGLVTSAIDHALAAEDHKRAAHLIEQVAEATLMRSEVVTLLRWIDRLPDELVRGSPSLCIYHAWALLWSARPWEEVEARLQHLARADQAPQGKDLASGQAASFRAFVALFRGQIPRADELSRRALDQLPPSDTFLRSLALWNLGILHMADGYAEDGIQALEEVARTSQAAGNIMVAVMVTCNLAELRLKQGRLRLARDLYQRALDLATDDQGRRLPIAGQALFGLGELSRQWNDLEAAAHYLQEGIELIEQWGQVGALEGHLCLARVRHALGDFDGAWAAGEKARQLAIQFDATDADDQAVAWLQARLWIAEGNLEAAQRCVEKPALDGDAATARPDSGRAFLAGRLSKYRDLMVARLRIAQNRPDEALALLEPLVARMEQAGRPDLTIEGRVLQTMARQAMGDTDQALANLECVLALAEPEGWVRVFVDEGEPMFRLLKQAVIRSLASEYVGRLLAAFNVPEDGSVGEKPRPRPHPQPLMEPLSDRELEVLRLLATGLSSPEIADKLYIAVSTVRSHCKNIYGKLDVHKRWDAVQQGQELGLI